MDRSTFLQILVKGTVKILWRVGFLEVLMRTPAKTKTIETILGLAVQISRAQ